MESESKLIDEYALSDINGNIKEKKKKKSNWRGWNRRGRGAHRTRDGSYSQHLINNDTDVNVLEMSMSEKENVSQQPSQEILFGNENNVSVVAESIESSDNASYKIEKKKKSNWRGWYTRGRGAHRTRGGSYSQHLINKDTDVNVLEMSENKNMSQQPSQEILFRNENNVSVVAESIESSDNARNKIEKKKKSQWRGWYRRGRGTNRERGGSNSQEFIKSDNGAVKNFDSSGNEKVLQCWPSQEMQSGDGNIVIANIDNVENDVQGRPCRGRWQKENRGRQRWRKNDKNQSSECETDSNSQEVHFQKMKKLSMRGRGGFSGRGKGNISQNENFHSDQNITWKIVKDLDQAKCQCREPLSEDFRYGNRDKENENTISSTRLQYRIRSAACTKNSDNIVCEHENEKCLPSKNINNATKDSAESQNDFTANQQNCFPKSKRNRKRKNQKKKQNKNEIQDDKLGMPNENLKDKQNISILNDKKKETETKITFQTSDIISADTHHIPDISFSQWFGQNWLETAKGGMPSSHFPVVTQSSVTREDSSQYHDGSEKKTRISLQDLFSKASLITNKSPFDDQASLLSIKSSVKDNPEATLSLVSPEAIGSQKEIIKHSHLPALETTSDIIQGDDYKKVNLAVNSSISPLVSRTIITSINTPKPNTPMPTSTATMTTIKPKTSMTTGAGAMITTKPNTSVPTSAATMITTKPNMSVPTSATVMIPTKPNISVPTGAATMITTKPNTSVPTSAATMITTKPNTSVPTSAATMTTIKPNTSMTTSAGAMITTKPNTSVPTSAATMITTKPNTPVPTSAATLTTIKPNTTMTTGAGAMITTKPNTPVPTSTATLTTIKPNTSMTTGAGAMITTKPNISVPTSAAAMIPTKPNTSVPTSAATMITTKPNTSLTTSVASKVKKSHTYKEAKYRLSLIPPEDTRRSGLCSKLEFYVSQHCKLVIKSYGDIAKEKSDLLVSLLGPEVDMKRTKVGQSFNREFPFLMEELNFYHKRNPYSKVLTIMNPIGSNCKAICHVILTPWDQENSQDQIETALDNIFNVARQLNIKSISIPPLGCGQAFRFPVNCMVEWLLKYIAHLKIEGELHKIVIVAPDSKLFHEFRQQGPFYFGYAVSDCLEDESLQIDKITCYLTLSQSPKRGTVDFMQFLAEQNNIFPSYWNNKEPSVFTLGGSIKNFVSNLIWRPKIVEAKLVDVDDETHAAIRKLVMETLDTSVIGHGADATNMYYSSIKVTSIQRVENQVLFEKYHKRRKVLLEKMIKKGFLCKDIGKITGSKGKLLTKKLLSDAMGKELYSEINETYLFHGTKENAISSIIENGFDPNCSKPAAMFGQGIYAAEKFTKADQYTDNKTLRTPNGTNLTLILTRMLLGNVFICDENHKLVIQKVGRKFKKPPCMNCLEDLCHCLNTDHYDSLMADGKWLFREFIVYESSQCYPEYLITYQRM